ncbi:hypothetical protein [Leptospira noguchii]|uniref:hypothetical protein n=1 Tax=Leptospira noguchii TaxID=28182 RepID=UPI0018DED263|nr:hypothetical protein [Leptospira noguchii]
MKFASCDDDPGNSVNAYLWVGVQGVVALSLLFAQIFLRPTHVILMGIWYNAKGIDAGELKQNALSN